MLTEALRQRAYRALDGLMMRHDADTELGAALRDTALLAGHPNFPLARPLSVPPKDPGQLDRYRAHWAKAVAEGRAHAD